MVLTLGSALLHEIGHLTAARLTHVPIAAVTVYPFGADIRLAPGLRSYRTDALIALAGAAANLLLAGVGALIGGAAGLFLTPCNLTLAGLNLLPIDGRPVSQKTSVRELYAKRAPMYASFRDVLIGNDAAIDDAAGAIWRDYCENTGH